MAPFPEPALVAFGEKKSISTCSVASLKEAGQTSSHALGILRVEILSLKAE